MRAQEFVKNFQGIDVSLEIQKDDAYVDDDDTDNQVVFVKATSNGKELGHVLFTMSYDGQGLILNPQDLEVDERYRGQGIARIMYDFVKSKGYRIRRSGQQTDAGAAFWQRHRPGQNIWENDLAEINFPDELSVSDQIIDYFHKRGYQTAGEGRDQIAFESPRGTVVKVLGLGEEEREQIVKNYVAFFMRNQRNPYYPRIYNTGEFTLQGETYFVYEMEYLNYVANEEATLEYLEDLMSATARGYAQAFQQNRPMPAELDEDEVAGLLMATEDLMDALGGSAPLDLSNIENLRRRNNGHLVIMDPFSL